jgi:hypothetical protein
LTPYVSVHLWLHCSIQANPPVWGYREGEDPRHYSSIRNLETSSRFTQRREDRARLTRRIDDELLDHFYSIFPEYKFDEAIAHLNENDMKSRSGKERWRSFIMPVSGRYFSCCGEVMVMMGSGDEVMEI